MHMSKAGTILLMGMLCFVHSLWAQNPVTGKVTDKNGAPIAGASVAVKNTSLATFTDENGVFTISAPARATLVISHVSYGSMEVLVTGPTVNVQMTEGENALSEVVVVGYGTRIKRDVTSSI